ncbi:hypothetical protein ABH932_005288 [Streptacidiphilus sp. MAP5-52]
MDDRLTPSQLRYPEPAPRHRNTPPMTGTPPPRARCFTRCSRSATQAPVVNDRRAAPGRSTQVTIDPADFIPADLRDLARTLPAPVCTDVQAAPIEDRRPPYACPQCKTRTQPAPRARHRQRPAARACFPRGSSRRRGRTPAQETLDRSACGHRRSAGPAGVSQACGRSRAARSGPVSRTSGRADRQSRSPGHRGGSPRPAASITSNPGLTISRSNSTSTPGNSTPPIARRPLPGRSREETIHHAAR